MPTAAPEISKAMIVNILSIILVPLIECGQRLPNLTNQQAQELLDARQMQQMRRSIQGSQ